MKANKVLKDIREGLIAKDLEEGDNYFAMENINGHRIKLRNVNN